MSEETLTPAELAVLFALMAEDREVSNVDLKARYGFTLTGKNKTHLNDLKLVSSRKVGQPLVHVLEERGWARCRAELTATPPPGAGTVAGGFYALLHGLNRYLETADLSLADMFRRPPAPPTPDPLADAETEIRAVYDQLATRPGARVRLADIRQSLEHLVGTDIDAALKRMIGTASVRLEAQENQQHLTAEDRAAKVRIGRRHYHFLIIERA